MRRKLFDYSDINFVVVFALSLMRFELSFISIRFHELRHILNLDDSSILH